MPLVLKKLVTVKPPRRILSNVSSAIRLPEYNALLVPAFARITNNPLPYATAAYVSASVPVLTTHVIPSKEYIHFEPEAVVETATYTPFPYAILFQLPPETALEVHVIPSGDVIIRAVPEDAPATNIPLPYVREIH